MKLRLRLGRWLLKPHWLPLLEHYNEMADATKNPGGSTNAERCTYIAIGIKRTIDV